MKYSQLIEKYKIKIDKTSCNGMASFTHFIHNFGIPNALQKYESHARGYLRNVSTNNCHIDEMDIFNLSNIEWDIPFPPNKKNSFKFIDLFAGIGGIRLPFHELGGRCVFTSEWDSFAKQTYAANYGEIPFGDITQIEAEEIPEFDILLGGFPCQAFSNAGHKKGFEDTRGTLFFDVARIINHHKPKAFLLENVKGLLSHNKGNTFEVIKQTLDKAGYNIHCKILAAKDFGVPQNRQRIYIVGFKKEDKIKFDFPEPTLEKVSVGDILEKNVDSKYTISDKLWAGHQRRKIQHKKNGNGFGYGLVKSESSYTNTISARYYKDGSEILIDQGSDINPRKLTPREALNLQGFPQNYKIVVSDTQQYKQAGNSVSVPVIRAISKKIIEALNFNEIN